MYYDYSWIFGAFTGDIPHESLKILFLGDHGKTHLIFSALSKKKGDELKYYVENIEDTLEDILEDINKKLDEIFNSKPKSIEDLIITLRNSYVNIAEMNIYLGSLLKHKDILKKIEKQVLKALKIRTRCNLSGDLYEDSKNILNKDLEKAIIEEIIRYIRKSLRDFFIAIGKKSPTTEMYKFKINRDLYATIIIIPYQDIKRPKKKILKFIRDLMKEIGTVWVFLPPSFVYPENVEKLIYNLTMLEKYWKETHKIPIKEDDLIFVSNLIQILRNTKVHVDIVIPRYDKVMTRYRSASEYKEKLVESLENISLCETFLCTLKKNFGYLIKNKKLIELAKILEKRFKRRIITTKDFAFYLEQLNIIYFLDKIKRNTKDYITVYVSAYETDIDVLRDYIMKSLAIRNLLPKIYKKIQEKYKKKEIIPQI